MKTFYYTYYYFIIHIFSTYSLFYFSFYHLLNRFAFALFFTVFAFYFTKSFYSLLLRYIISDPSAASTIVGSFPNQNLLLTIYNSYPFLRVSLTVSVSLRISLIPASKTNNAK